MQQQRGERRGHCRQFSPPNLTFGEFRQLEQELLLETGKEPMMRTDAGTMLMGNQKLSSPQVIGPSRGTAAGVHKENIAARRQTNFEYTHNGRSHTVTFMTQGEQARRTFSITDVGQGCSRDAIKAGQDADPVGEARPTAPSAAAASPAAAKSRPALGKEPEINVPSPKNVRDGRLRSLTSPPTTNR